MLKRLLPWRAAAKRSFLMRVFWATGILRRRFPLKELDAAESRKASKAELVAEVARVTGLRKELIFRHDRIPGAVAAKAVYCYLMRERGRVSGVILGKELGLSSGAISHLCQKGGDLVKSY